MKFAKSRLIPVYQSDGKTSNIKFAKDKAGVYMIYISGQLRYVGYSAGQLEKTIMRHFQSWPDRTQVRTSYGTTDRVRAQVRITLTTPERARKLEAALLIKYKPVDNPLKLKRFITEPEQEVLTDWDGNPVCTVKEMEEAPF